MQIRTRFLSAAVTAGTIAAAALLPASAAAEPAVALQLGASLTDQRVVFFDTARPLDTTKRIITGLSNTNELVTDIDARPATGGIYISTVDNTDNATGNVQPDVVRIYTVDAATGAATLVGGVAPIADLPSGESVSIDFNPVADRLRVIATSGESYRTHPDTGALVARETANITGTPRIGSNAYDRSVAGTTATTLYGIDDTTDNLVVIGSVNGTPDSPNGGVATVIGSLGDDVDAGAGFDISGSTNTAYVVDPSQGLSENPELRTVNLTTGASTRVSDLDQFITGFALLAPSTIALATNAQNAEERTNKVEVTVVRTGSTLLPGSVDFATADGTAKAGSDYTATSGTLRFAAGETTKTIVIAVTDDGTGDDKETFTIDLSNAAGASLGVARTTLTTVETTTGDKQAPGLNISDLGLKAYKYFSRFGLKTTYSCSEACKTVYTIRLGTSGYLAKGTGELRRPGVGVANAPITMLGKARLKSAFAKTRASMIRAQFTIQVTDTNGNKRIAKRYFFILR